MSEDTLTLTALSPEGEAERRRAKRTAARHRSWRRLGADPSRWAKYALHAARGRAKRLGVEFDLSPEDLLPLPEICPLLGIGLDYSTGSKGRKWHASSPSLDRLDNTKGYAPDNVWIISNRANTLKRDATLEELETLVGCLRGALKRRDRVLAARRKERLFP